MESTQSKMLRRVLPLLGTKSFFDVPEKVPSKLLKVRKKGPSLPSKRFRRKFNVSELSSRPYRVFEIKPLTSHQETEKCVLYFHGGGYVLDLDAVHWNFIGRLIDNTGYSVIVPVYPLAPETQCIDLIPAMTSLFIDAAESYGSKNITLMGDSAGGGLSLAVAHALRDNNLTSPDRVVLLSPWLDVVSNHPLQPKLEKKDPIVSMSALKGFGQLYAGDLPLTDPRVSPLFGKHNDLPPIQLFIGTDDPLLPDATRFRDIMKALKTPILYHEYENMFHVWMLLPIPEGKKVMGEISEFLG